MDIKRYAIIAYGVVVMLVFLIADTIQHLKDRKPR